MENQILVVENLTVSFGRLLAVNNLSFEVREGEVLGVIGPNGAGKTTVLNALIGLVTPESGRIVFQGHDITRLPPYARCRLGLGRTYQIPRPFENMSVFENLLVGAVYGAGLSERRAAGRADEILALTGLAEKRDLPAGKLGLLDRKRLELARGLATDPRVLLLDEVAAGLTEAEVKVLLELVRQIRKTGVTIVWIEHILLTMLEGADRVLCVAAGRGVACGEPREVMASKEVQDLYLGAEED